MSEQLILLVVLIAGASGWSGRSAVQAAVHTDERLEAIDASLDSSSEPSKSAPASGEEPRSQPAAGPEQLAQAAPAAIPSTLSLELGEVRSLDVEGVTRIAIGDPNIADVTIVSLNKVLLHATAAGTTNLILWDQKGEHVSSVEIVDRSPESIEKELRQVLTELDIPNVQVKREQEKVFLVGEVQHQAELDRLEQMLGAYKGKVTNLVSIPPPPPPPPATPPPSIKLTVQVIEMDRDGTENLGVKWADKLTFTETTFGALTPQTASLHERIDEAFRFGSLSRTGLNPILNMLISKGKARILSEPKLVAASGKEATAFMGVEVPVLTATSVSAGVVTQSIEFKNTGVELTFQPTLLPDGSSIQLVVNAKVASLDKTVGITVSGVLVPGFKTRQTKTELVVNTGESVLISGLLQDEEKKNLSQVPAIGSVPVLGTLFRSTEFVRGQTELILVVTPELTAEEGSSEERAFLLDQALANAELAGSVNDPMLRYAVQIQDRISKALRYPSREKEAGINGRVRLRLHLFRDGTLDKAMVMEPSGVEMFDTEALKAAESQAPYPPFPSDLSQQDLWLEVPVLFRP